MEVGEHGEYEREVGGAYQGLDMQYGKRPRLRHDPCLGQDDTDDPGQDYAYDHGAPVFEVPYRYRRDDAEEAQEDSRVGQVPEGEGVAVSVDDYAASVHPYDRDEQADPRDNGGLHGIGDGVDQDGPVSRDGEKEEHDAGYQYDHQCLRIVEPHLEADGVCDERVDSHSGRQAGRESRIDPHQQRGYGRCESGLREQRVETVLLCAGHGGDDVGVDDEDVGHREERDDPAPDLGLDGGAPLGDPEEAV